MVAALRRLSPSIGSRCVAQCPSDHLAHFEHAIGLTYLRCEYSSDSNGSTIRWTITRPNVTRQLTDYRDITFSQGDQVWFPPGAAWILDEIQIGMTGEGTWIQRAAARTAISTDSSGSPEPACVTTESFLLRPLGQAQFGYPASRLGTITPMWELLTIQPPPQGTLPTLRLGYEVDYDRSNKQGQRPAAARSDTTEGVGSEMRGDRAPESTSVVQSGQCKGEPVASVSILIKRGLQNAGADLGLLGQSLAQTRSLLPFRSRFYAADDNGFIACSAFVVRKSRETRHVFGLEVVDDCKNFEYGGALAVRFGVWVRKKSPCTQAASFDVPAGFVTSVPLRRVSGSSTDM